MGIVTLSHASSPNFIQFANIWVLLFDFVFDGLQESLEASNAPSLSLIEKVNPKTPTLLFLPQVREEF